MLKKHRVLIQSASNLTKNQRLAYNVLLSMAKKQLDENLDTTNFKTSYQEVKEQMSEKRLNNAELRKSLEGLTTSGITMNILKNEEFEYGKAMSLVAEIQTDKDYNLEFILSPTIRRNVIRPKMFCPIDIKLESRFESKHTIPIYEYCKDYIKVEIPRLTVETFKQMLGIGGGYARTYDMRKKIIEPAIKEINEKTDITITSYELIRQGKKHKWIKFVGELKDGDKPPKPKSPKKSEGKQEEKESQNNNSSKEEIKGQLPKNVVLTLKTKGN